MSTRRSKEAFPEKDRLKRVRDRLSDPNYKGGDIAVPANGTKTDLAKYEICQLIARYRREHDLMQKELAERIGVDESRISDILHGKIESFTLDRLVSYGEKIFPSLRISIHAA
jgi:predicted XRE-type DNA-binding protein